MNYSNHFQTQVTPQTQKIPNTTQVANNAGGFVWAVDDWKRLDRFLILGSEGGTYYVGERELTVSNAEAVVRCILSDGVRVVNRVVEISHNGRAAKNDPALFVLAMCAKMGDLETRKAALGALSQVARIGTHLFHFVEFITGFKGIGGGKWNRGMRTAFANWYTNKSVEDLAYQVVKYQSRDKWSHRDILRLAHVQPTSDEIQNVFKWIVKRPLWEQSEVTPNIIVAFEAAKTVTTEKEIVTLIKMHGLPREAIPTQFLKSKAVWEAMLPTMGLGAMIRNLGVMSANEVIKPISKVTDFIVSQLTNPELIKKSRIHPMTVLIALRQYGAGKGLKGSLEWGVNSKVMNALDEAFYLSFGNVQSTGKRLMLALDVSGSMADAMIDNTNLSARDASAAMAMVIARTEPQHCVTIFSTGGDKVMTGEKGYRQTAIGYYDITPRQRLDDVIDRVRNLPFNGTDCSLPMIFALKEKLEIDTFIIFTDSETFAGNIHPSQALQNYRTVMGINSKLIVVAMTSNGFTIADPNDSGMLDVVGFDTATPNLITDFMGE